MLNGPFLTHDARSWYAVQAVATKERLAIRHLLRQGYDVFWPHYLAAIRDGTRRGYAFRSWLPPAWLFVAEHDDVTAIRSSMCVLGILQVGGQPLLISFSQLVGLRSIADPSGLVPRSRPRLLAPGNMVEIRGSSLIDCLDSLNSLKLRVWAEMPAQKHA